MTRVLGDGEFFDICNPGFDAEWDAPPCTPDAPCAQCRHLDAVPEDEPVRIVMEAA